jgi:uncharacterized RDD family membrane protein YckC
MTTPEAAADGPAGRTHGVRGRLGHLAGSLSNRVLEEVDADGVLRSIDVDALVGRLDVDALIARVDVDALVGRLDINGLLDRIEVNALLGRVDINPVLDRIDVDALLGRADIDAVLQRADIEALSGRIDVERLLERVDLEALVRRAGIPEIVADSTGQVAGSALDLGRRQVVGLDVGSTRMIQRLLRRDPDTLPAGPPALVSDTRQRIQAPEPTDARRTARFEVSGFYAGPLSRAGAFALDVAVATSAFTAGAAALTWMLDTILGIQLHTADRSGLLWTLAFVGWLLTYWWGSTALAGRTPAMLLAGCRIVARDGTSLSPGRALIRTVLLPVSLLAFGAGAAWMLVDRERRALHDLLAGSTVVYDWGGRPAEMPTPLARWIETHSD